MKAKCVKIEQSSVIRKIICMAIVLIILVGEFLLPAEILAVENYYTEMESIIVTNESTNANENESVKSYSDNLEYNEKNQKQREQENQEDLANLKEQSKDENSINEESSTETNNGKKNNTTAESNEKSNNDKTVEDNNEAKDEVLNEADKKEESAKGANSGISETNDNSSDNVLDQKEPSLMLRNTPINNLLTVNNSLSLQNVNNATEETKTLEELDREIKATTKEGIEELKQNNKFKTKNDKYELKTLEIQFLSGASKDDNGNFVWNATSSAKGHEFTFRVNYAISGYGELPVGAVQITIPRRILRNRSGNLDDYYEMSLPTLKECEEEGEIPEFIYKEDGNYLVIYNSQKIDAGGNGYFEISYGTNSATYNYKDYDKTNIDLVKNGGTASDGFYAIMELNVENDSLNNITDDKSVFINTDVNIQSTQKRYPNIYRDWNTSWMAVVPEDSDEYYYLVWEINSYIENVTQKYNFTLEDFITNLTDGTQDSDYELVGYKLSGEKYYSDKNTEENQASSGYRYDSVLTRHKKEVFAGKSYKLKNSVTATVHPIDGVDSDTSATSSNTFNWDPTFIPPTGHFNNYKYGNNTYFGGRYANYNLDRLQNGEVNELKGFKYRTVTSGYAYPWTLSDGGNTDNPLDYGVNSVNYDTWDDTLYLEDDENPMNADDYYLECFTYSISNYDAEYDDFYNKFNQVSVNYDDNEVITFYAKFGDRNSERRRQLGRNWNI